MIDPAWAAVASALLFGVGELCNRRVVGWLPDDPPGPGRKQHGRPMPLAGVLLVPAFAPWWVDARAWPLVAAVLVAAAVGFVDDRRKERGSGLDWRWKGAGLALAAGAVATAAHDPLAAPGTWSLAFGLVFVLTNATNFLDNTDGVAAGLSAVTLLALAGRTGEAMFAAAGFAALGFVPWNWPWPRLFLGDGGAYALGVAVGAAVVLALPADPLAWTACAVQLADFAQVVVARLVIGVPPWIGDRRHLTHIVQNLGLRRPLVAPLFTVLGAAAAFAPRW